MIERPGRIKEATPLKVLVKQLLTSAQCPDKKAKVTIFGRQRALAPATFCHVTQLRQMNKPKKIIGVHIIRGSADWQHECRVFTRKPAEMLAYLDANLIITNGKEAA